MCVDDEVNVGILKSPKSAGGLLKPPVSELHHITIAKAWFANLACERSVVYLDGQVATVGQDWKLFRIIGRWKYLVLVVWIMLNTKTEQ